MVRSNGVFSSCSPTQIYCVKALQRYSCTRICLCTRTWLQKKHNHTLPFVLYRGYVIRPEWVMYAWAVTQSCGPAPVDVGPVLQDWSAAADLTCFSSYCIFFVTSHWPQRCALPTLTCLMQQPWNKHEHAQMICESNSVTRCKSIVAGTTHKPTHWLLRLSTPNPFLAEPVVCWLTSSHSASDSYRTPTLSSLSRWQLEE